MSSKSRSRAEESESRRARNGTRVESIAELSCPELTLQDYCGLQRLAESRWPAGTKVALECVPKFTLFLARKSDAITALLMVPCVRETDLRAIIPDP